MRSKPLSAAIFVLGLCWGAEASAQDQTAYENANCNASFLGDCPVSEAPLPLMGGGLGGAIILGGAAAWLWRRSKG